ncbi:GntR family transcriptional regulator [Promicromonospora sukumoe]|uniref:GntR family transcriptional regulator n=1 Tax=Promicromonospora sukumoe TaxID=88382 RepID=A0A7W3J8S1_9MICO|nr:GntR family transcriptional regulator [Promicromonospora sukumoe]MBA8808355.1 GntR family transcriptional regulator [Promicromonospora sukumoe]
MANPVAIDRTSPLPLYWQLKARIVRDIEERGLEPGARLPGDHELCDQYGVSRTVVRQALRELEVEGVIRREKGRGTFVADRRTARGFGHALVGTFEDIQSSGRQESTVLRREVVDATAVVARDLALADGERVVEIERLRLVDGEPWALTSTQLPRDVGEPLLDVDLRNVSIYGVLEREFGVQFDRAERTVEAEIVDEAVAEVLGIAAGSAVLVMHSVSFDPTGRPIERFTGIHRGDRNRLDIEVTRSTAG